MGSLGLDNPRNKEKITLLHHGCLLARDKGFHEKFFVHLEFGLGTEGSLSLLDLRDPVIMELLV